MKKTLFLLVILTTLITPATPALAGAAIGRPPDALIPVGVAIGRPLDAPSSVGAVIGRPPSAATAFPAVSARCAVVTDADTGAVLYEKEADSRSLIASTTKIMTGLLVCRDLDLDAVVTVPDDAIGVEGSSMYLRRGERMTVRDLAYGLLLHSGNDAAAALAILHSGSEEAFAAEMNRTAGALGLSDSHFANPHGLDSADNYSTARDLAWLAAAALENDAFRRIVSARTWQAPGERFLTNHNRLLWQYEGCIGVKTGYTRAAGRILVSAAEREGRRLICVTIRDPDDWRDHCVLLDRAFALYELRELARKGETLTSDADGCPLTALASLTVPLRPEEDVRLEFVPRFAPALDPDPAAGVVRVWLDGRLLAEVPVTRPNNKKLVK